MPDDKDKIKIKKTIKVEEKLKKTTTPKNSSMATPDISSELSEISPEPPKDTSSPTVPTESQPQPKPQPQPSEASQTQSPDNSVSRPQPSTPKADNQPATTDNSPEGISPQIDKTGLQKPVDLGKKDAKDRATHEGLKAATKSTGREAVAQGAKKAEQAAIRAVKEMAKKIGAAAAKFMVTPASWPMWVVIIILVIILLIVSAVPGGTAVLYETGYGGKTNNQLAGAESQQVKDIVADNAAAAGGTNGSNNASSFHKFDFLDSSDHDALTSGKLDKRLLVALHYLAGKHNRVAASHFVSAYNNMPTDPESSDQLSQNVSSHKQGLAADISQIDFVYKSVEPSQICRGGGGSPPLNDIVYAADSLPTSDPAALASVSTPTDFNDLAGSLQTAASQINKMDPTVRADLDAKMAALNSALNQTIAQVQGNVQGLNAYVAKVPEMYAKINDFKTSIDQSTLVQAQKDAINAKLATLASQLQLSSYRIDTLSNLGFQGQQIINDYLAQLSTDTAALSGTAASIQNEIDSANKMLATINSFQNLSDLRNLGALTGNLNNLGNDFDGITGVLTSNNEVAITNAFNTLMDGFDVFGGLMGSDQNELVRLYCEGGVATGATTRTAIPIKVSWQDDKPDIAHASADADESTTTDARVFYTVYRPQAQTKVHQVVGELLQFPYDMNNVPGFRITQFITFSQERDVDPFSALLDKIYGKPRPGNYGLFSMPESWAQVHVGY